MLGLSQFLCSAIKTLLPRTSLVVQWLRVHLSMQGTCVLSLVQEDSTCRGATKLMYHNYWVHTLEPELRNKRNHIIRSPCTSRMSRPFHHTKESPSPATKTQRNQTSKKKKKMLLPHVCFSLPCPMLCRHWLKPSIDPKSSITPELHAQGSRSRENQRLLKRSIFLRGLPSWR